MGRSKNKIELSAQILSDLFSPILLPSYMTALAMWFTPLAFVPIGPRVGTIIAVFVLTAVLPAAVIFMLIRSGRAKDVSLSSIRERPIPYAVSVLCYLATACYLHFVHAPQWLAAFFLGAGASAVAAFAITAKWKISAHSSAVGGVAAALTWMAFNNLFLAWPLFWVIGSIALCGLIGSSRLILGRHTLAQVLAGYALGAASVLALLRII